MKYLVIGAGISGIAACEYLVHKGHDVALSERGALPVDLKNRLIKQGVTVLDGGHSLTHLDSAEAVVISPGLPSTHPLVVEAKQRNLSVISEIDLGLQEYSGTVIGVTGTNGKSTTCAMLAHGLNCCSVETSLSGNIGIPPTQLATTGKLKDTIVLELSSYQLDTSEDLHPAASMFTSFSQDHLERHGTLENYFRAKWKLVTNTLPRGVFVTTKDILARAAEYGLNLPKSKIYSLVPKGDEPCAPGEFAVTENTLHIFGEDSIDLKPAQQILRHNQINLAFSLLVARHLFNLGSTKFVESMLSFKHLRHRCQMVGNLFGNPIINDSKATNLESVLAMLSGLEFPIVLLLGGQGKGENFEEIKNYSRMVKSIVTFGKDGPSITKQILPLESRNCSTFEEAVPFAFNEAKRLQCSLVLSPGCASFDEFRSFEERGDRFIGIINSFPDTIEV